MIGQYTQMSALWLQRSTMHFINIFQLYFGSKESRKVMLPLKQSTMHVEIG